MSHFSVTVVTKAHPTQSVIDAVMAPFHEFECTGIDDQYVQSLDITAEKREEYAKDTMTRLRDAAGVLHYPYDDQYYREFTSEELAKVGPLSMLGTGSGSGLSWHSKDWGDGKGYRAKVTFVPEGMEKVTVPASEVYTFVEWLEDYNGRTRVPYGEQPDTTEEHKYGYFTTDAAGEVTAVIERTNPNRKWDWWQIGGRYSDRLLKGTPGNCVPCNSCNKSLIQWQAMRDKKYSDRCEVIGDTLAAISTKSDQTVAKLLEMHKAAAEQYAAMRAEYEAAGMPGAWMDVYNAGKAGAIAEAEAIGLWDGKDNLVDDWFGAGVSRSAPDPYEEARQNSAFSTFALLKDGKWMEKGEMLMFGMAANEKKPQDWQTEYAEALASVPDDHYITIVDCHI